MNNNPRNWGGAVSLEVYRGKYDTDELSANLYINVSFLTGRVSESNSSGLRFKLSIKRAEVCILKDSSGLLRVPLNDIYRPGSFEAQYENESLASDELSAGARLDASASILSFDGASKSSTKDKMTFSAPLDGMRVIHRRNGEEHVYDISPLSGQTLQGNPWEPGRKILSLNATGCNKSFEPPEPTVQIRCLREDLEITDVQYHGDAVFNFAALTKNKKVAVEAYIKEQLALCGLHQSDLSDPYATIVIADAVPEVS